MTGLLNLNLSILGWPHTVASLIAMAAFVRVMFASNGTPLHRKWGRIYSALLEIESDIKVVGRAVNGWAALEITLKHKPDILISDIEMPEITRPSQEQATCRWRQALLAPLMLP